MVYIDTSLQKHLMQGCTKPRFLVARENKSLILAPNIFLIGHAVLQSVETLCYKPQDQELEISH